MNKRGTVTSVEGDKARVAIDGEDNNTVLLSKLKHVGILYVGDLVLVSVINGYVDAVISGVII